MNYNRFPFKTSIPRFLVIALLGILICPDLPAQKNVFGDWLSDNAIPLPSPEDAYSTSAYQPLAPLLKDAEIIALGEATHGTREFFLFKHHLLRMAVQELGIRLFGMEASYAASLKVNDYITTGSGTAKEVVSGMGFWVWNTEEVVGMVEWMRKWNQSHPEDMVEFHGFDMQSFVHPVEALIEYSAEKAPQLALDHAELFKTIQEHTSFVFKPEEAETLIKKAEILQAQLLAGEYGLTDLSPYRRDVVLHLGTTLVQALNLSIEPYAHYRDECMALNTDIIRNFGGKKKRIVLWAHNGHISRSEAPMKYLPMGYYLGNRYKDKYYALGFDFGEGNFRAVHRKEGKIMEHTANWPPKKNSPYWEALYGLKGEASFFSLRDSYKDPLVGKYLKKYTQIHSIGAVYDEKLERVYAVRKSLKKEFDGLLWIDRSHSSIPVEKRDLEGMGSVKQQIEWQDEWASSRLRLKARMKMEGDGEGQIWLRLNGSGKQILSFKNMDGEPATSGGWQTYTVEISGQEGGKYLYPGAFLLGGGTLLIDDFALEIKTKTGWKALTLGNSNFDAATEMAPWTGKGDGYQFTLVENEPGNKVLMIRKEQVAH